MAASNATAVDSISFATATRPSLNVLRWSCHAESRAARTSWATASSITPAVATSVSISALNRACSSCSRSASRASATKDSWISASSPLRFSMTVLSKMGRLRRSPAVPCHGIKASSAALKSSSSSPHRLSSWVRSRSSPSSRTVARHSMRLVRSTLSVNVASAVLACFSFSSVRSTSSHAVRSSASIPESGPINSLIRPTVAAGISKLSGSSVFCAPSLRNMPRRSSSTVANSRCRPEISFEVRYFASLSSFTSRSMRALCDRILLSTLMADRALLARLTPRSDSSNVVLAAADSRERRSASSCHPSGRSGASCMAAKSPDNS